MYEPTAEDPGLQLTPAAKAHIARSLAKVTQYPVMGIRIGVKKAGCSGYEYVLEAAKQGSERPFDHVFAFETLHILIDKEIYYKFLKGGTVIDFKKEGLKEGLAFNNPNVAHQCGCGESFTLVGEAHE